MKLSLKILIICLFCGGIFSLYKFIPPKYTKIQSIHIFLSSQESKQTGKKNEDSFLTPKEQKKLLSLMEKYKNRFIWSINLKGIAQEIQELFPSKKAFVRRQLPNELEIHLTENRPAFLLLTDSGRFHPVSFEGDISPPLSFNQMINLPIARGDIFKKNKSLRLQILHLLNILPKKEIFSEENISEFVYKPQRESFVVFLIPHYFILEIRVPWEKKTIKNINFVLNYLIQKEEKAALIDARFPEKIIVRRKSGS